MSFFFIFVVRFAFSARHFTPSRDCGLCHLSISCWFSPLRLAPRHDGGPREGFDVGFPCHSVCVSVAFLRLAPPPATLAARGRFETVVCLIIAPFFVSPPRHAGCTREVFCGGLPFYNPCVFLQIVFFAFFLAYNPVVQRCGSGFEGAASSTHVLVSGTGLSPNFPYLCIYMRLIRVG